jgi:hypothetical protein
LAPLVSNQLIWVEYSTLENCCDPLYLWVITYYRPVIYSLLSVSIPADLG